MSALFYVGTVGTYIDSRDSWDSTNWSVLRLSYVEIGLECFREYGFLCAYFGLLFVSGRFRLFLVLLHSG